MQRTRIRDRFRYWFDTQMAKGTTAQIAVLAIASLALVVLSALAIVIFGLYPTGPDSALNPSGLEVLWDALVRALSSGSIREDVGWGYRAVMLGVTIGGLVIVAALIGVVSTALEARLRRFRDGRSQVLERGHTVILGWSPTVIPIVRELIDAHGSSRGPSIAILADIPAASIVEQLAIAFPGRRRARIVVRSGDPKSRDALAIVSLDTARGIIIVSPDGSADPDIDVLSTALAIVRAPERRSREYSVVAELRNPAMLRTAAAVSRSEVRWVLADDLIARITVQSARHTGLSSVYTEMLDFAGDEFYVLDSPGLVGRTYREACRAFATSSVVGFAALDRVELNPAPGRVLAPGERIIVIAESAAAAIESAPQAADETRISSAIPVEAGPERTIVLGYHAGCRRVITELLDYLPPGASITVASAGDAPADFAELGPRVSWRESDPTDPDDLEAIAPEEYDHIIVVPLSDDLAPAAADARTLVTLLGVRDRLSLFGKRVPLVSQMLDVRNCELAGEGEFDDFVVSDRLVSLMLAQVSQTPQLFDVFDALLSPEGSEFYVRPASQYVVLDEPVTTYTVLEAGARRGETVIGYRFADSRVVINPAKSRSMTFTAGDSVIVLAEQ